MVVIETQRCQVFSVQEELHRRVRFGRVGPDIPPDGLLNPGGQRRVRNAGPNTRPAQHILRPGSIRLAVEFRELVEPLDRSRARFSEVCQADNDQDRPDPNETASPASSRPVRDSIHASPAGYRAPRYDASERESTSAALRPVNFGYSRDRTRMNCSGFFGAIDGTSCHKRLKRPLWRRHIVEPCGRISDWRERSRRV
jgi:hypothetical protein